MTTSNEGVIGGGMVSEQEQPSMKVVTVKFGMVGEY